MVSSQRDEQRLASERAHVPDETAATGPDAQQQFAIRFAHCFGKISALFHRTKRPPKCEAERSKASAWKCRTDGSGKFQKRGSQLGVQVHCVQ